MINASREFKEKLKSGANIVNYADVTLADGTVLHLTYKDFMVGGCSIEDKTTDGKFGVGFCIGKTLTIKLANHDEQFSQYDFFGAIIHLYVATLLDDGTIEKIRKGIYYATVPSTPGDIIQINAVDGMYRLDKDYSASSTVYPATLQTILTDACVDCGIPIGFRQFDNMGFIVQSRPEKATYRQVVTWACQIAGYNARIDNDGYMQLIWYNASLLDWYNFNGGDFKVYPHDTVVDGGNFTDYSTGMVISGGTFTDETPEHIFRIKSLEVHTDDVQITGVRIVGNEDVSELAGEEGYVIEIKDNPFSSGKERAVADYLGGRMVGMMFRPFSAQVLGNPLYEPFDIVKVSDKKGNVYLSLLNSVSYTVGTYTQISCEAEDPLRNGSKYFSESAAAVVEARRNAEKQLTEYDKAVQNMNQLAGNALGYHTTYETQPDGSRITYLHDKPSLADSKTIYKQTIDGFFISTDGGKTYTAGFDSQGNVVVNILYAIGIVADWIRSGRLECRKGDKITFLADVDTGEVRIVADSFSLSSGQTIDNIAQEKANGALNSANEYTNQKAGETLKSANNYANTAAQNAVNNQTQADIFNRLTNNGAAKGMWLKDNQLYFSFTYAEGGTLVLGGANNGNGQLVIKNAYGIQIGYIDNTGVHFNEGSFTGTVNATTLKSANAEITGGKINIFSDNQNTNRITVKFLTYSASMSPMYITAESLKGNSSLSSGYIHLTYNDVTTSIYGSNAEFGGFVTINGVLTARGNLVVLGNKSRCQKTKNYSDRLLFCYEMTKPYFGDIGEATLDDDGICYIFLDDIFAETVNTDCQYQVFLQKYGPGDVWVEERSANYFIVRGTAGLRFGWEIKARQLGFETERLEKFSREETEPSINYETEAQNYIDNFYKEVYNYE